MAGIGLRKPYYAKYSYDEETGKAAYTGGGLLAKAVEFSASIESADDNDLWADDTIAESDRSFGSGTISLTTDDLTPTASAAVLGVEMKKVTVGGQEVDELVYDEDVSAPYLGFGVIIPKKKDGVPCFRAIVFPKIMFSVPEDAAATSAGKIEWKTPTVEGTILRSDAEKHPWKREITAADEATAEAYIKQCLKITAAPLAKAPVVTTESLPDGTAGAAYDQALKAAGDAPMTWLLESGSLPEGLALASDGQITGTPTQAGESSFTVKAANRAGAGTKPLTLTVAAAE